MIVRTAPVILPEPDAMRAMERLESQLRRAADDLAQTLEDMRAAAEAPLLEIPDPVKVSRCNEWMPHRRAFCGRFAGHRDSHRTREAMDAEASRKRTSR